MTWLTTPMPTLAAILVAGYVLSRIAVYVLVRWSARHAGTIDDAEKAVHSNEQKDFCP